MEPTNSDIALLAVISLAEGNTSPRKLNTSRHQVNRLITMRLLVTIPTAMDIILNPSTRVIATPAGHDLLKKHHLNVFGQEHHRTSPCEPYLWDIFATMIKRVSIHG